MGYSRQNLIFAISTWCVLGLVSSLTFAMQTEQLPPIESIPIYGSFPGASKGPSSVSQANYKQTSSPAIQQSAFTQDDELVFEVQEKFDANTEQPDIPDEEPSVPSTEKLRADQLSSQELAREVELLKSMI